MKKVLAVLAAGVLAFGFVGCSNDDKSNDDPNRQTQTDNGDKKSGEKKSGEKKSGEKKDDKKSEKKEKKSSAAKEISTKQFLETYGPKQDFKQVHVITKADSVTIDQKIDYSGADEKVYTVMTYAGGTSESLSIGDERWEKVEGQWKKATGISLAGSPNSSKSLFESMKGKGSDSDKLKLVSDKDGLLVYEGSFDGNKGSFTVQSDTGYVTSIKSAMKAQDGSIENVEIIQDQFNVDPGIKAPA